MADANTDAPIIVADMRGDRAQAVVAGDAAADRTPHLARRQLDLVVKHTDVTRCKLLKLHRLGDSAAGFIHEGSRQKQQYALAADRPLAGDTLEAPAPRSDAVALGDFLKRH